MLAVLWGWVCGSFSGGSWRSCWSALGSGRPLGPGSFSPGRRTDPSPGCAGKAARGALGGVSLHTGSSKGQGPGACFLSTPQGSSRADGQVWSALGESLQDRTWTGLSMRLLARGCHRAGVCWWDGQGAALWGWSWAEAEQLLEGKGAGVFWGAPRGCCRSDGIGRGEHRPLLLCCRGS